MIFRAWRSPLSWLGGLLALYLLVPIVAFLWRLAGSQDRGFNSPDLWSALGTSVLSACISAAIVTVLGIPLAFWLARSRSRLSRVVGLLVQLPLALPPVMSGIVLIYIVGPYTTLGQWFDGALTDSVVGIVIAQTFVASPFLIISARSAFATVEPALDELAATLGHRPLARFWLVDLRIAAPGIRAGVLLTWLRAIGEYGATVLLAYHPYTLPVFTYVQFSSTGIPTTQAPTALALGMAAVVLLLAQLRRPARWRARAHVPDPVAPNHPELCRVEFELDVAVGSFRLQVGYRAGSSRIAILGRSGAGKTLTLRGIAGLLGSGAGTVRYDDDAVDRVPVEGRRLGYVPQHLGLLPGRTVWQQVLFGTEADPRLAAWWLRTLGIDELVERLPTQLSGGQRQRVSLAQALSRNPRLVLLDEPFSALDAPIRAELRLELRRLQRDAGLSTILVTHDPEEAALLADEIIVIDAGRVLQAGPKEQIYHRPASPAVAALLGIANIQQGRSAGPAAITAAGRVIPTAPHDVPVGSAVLWSIRPEQVTVAPDAADGATAATVLDAADLGTTTLLTARLGDEVELQVRGTDLPQLEPGTTCWLTLPPSAVSVWVDAGSGQAAVVSSVTA